MPVQLLQTPRWTLGNISFNYDETADSAGCVWAARLVGWHDVKTRPNRPTRPLPIDGNYLGPNPRDEQIISIEGYCVAPTALIRNQAENRLASALLGPYNLYTLVVTEESGDYQRSVTLEDSKTVRVNEYAFSFSIQVAAHDPRKFSAGVSGSFTASTGLGEDSTGGLDFTPVGYEGLDFTPAVGQGLQFGTPSTAGTLTVDNQGNIATDVVLQVQGPLTAPIRITNQSTGQEMVYNQNIATGETLIIDTNTRTVTLGGSSRRSFLVVPEWWKFPPGQTVLTFSHAGAFNSTARLTATWRNAFA